MLKTTNVIKTKSFKLAVYQKGSIESDKLALVLPGKLDTKDYPHMRSHVDFLSTKGYLALSFDPPGTWESEGKISEYNITNYLKAIVELIEYFGNKPTLLIGHSRRGSMSILAGTKLEQVKEFVAIMFRYSYQSKKIDSEKWDRGFKISTRDTPEEYEERNKKFKLPYSFVVDSAKYDLTEDLKTCTKPKLFIAGSRDDQIDPLIVREAYEISAEPKKFEMLDSDHDYRRDPERIQKVNEIISEFLKTLD